MIEQEEDLEDNSTDDEFELEYEEDVGTKGKHTNDEYSYTIKVPKDRVAVIIGIKGKEKQELEEYSHSKLSIDSKEGDVTITGKDALKLYEIREVIKAIARGFSPEAARVLLKSDYMLEIINLKDYGMENQNKLLRVRARIIGTGGKARRTMETLTNTSISIYGKTISIIGECSEVTYAKRAIEMLISGSMHATVYKWLEKQRRKIREEQKGF
jgi:ribosomal RNA assembly protein